MILAQVGSQVVTQSGIGIGAAVAIVLSWHRNKSILLAIIHGILSWFYVIYFALTRRDNEK
jgi:fucose permease